MSTPVTTVHAGAAWIDDTVRREVSIRIENERVVEIVDGFVGGDIGGDVLDWRSLLVLPGAIDTHSHHREPGFEHKETIATATRAAARGGVTITVGMPNVEPPIVTVDRYRALMDHYAEHAIVDFNVNPAPTIAEEVLGLAEAGALGFKIFMVVDTKRSYPHMPGLGIEDDATLVRVAESVAPTGIPLMVHPHNQAIMNLAEHRTWGQGKRTPEDYARAQRLYDGLVWDTANETLLSLQEAIGFRLHILHLISVRSVEMVRAAKAAGRSVTGEVNPFGLFLGDMEQIRERGPYACGRWSPPHVKKALIAGLRDRTIDVIGSDHAPHTREEKEPGWEDMWKAPSGTPQLQHYLACGLTWVNEGRISLGDLVHATSTGPAKTFGLYPDRGVVAPGAYADLIGVDLARRWTVRNEDVESQCGWTPYDGDELTGKVIHTLVRGNPVMIDEELVAPSGSGRLARRVNSQEER
ncbi:MAG: amidohydrolase family protein 4 [Rhodoglobus sp.]|nr:amidohydrolase family protein 4 [Rhodoglobus sp.]